MSFALYTIGTVILVAGVLYACHLSHMPTAWTGVIALVLVGAGIMGAVSSTRQKDPN